MCSECDDCEYCGARYQIRGGHECQPGQINKYAAEREARRLAEIERRERAELARLKAKYEDKK